MLVRYTAALVLALGITFGLFFTMQLLISMGANEFSDIGKGNVIEFVRLKRQSELQLRKRQLPKKKKPPKPPPPPEMKMAAPDTPDQGEMAFAAPSLDLDLNIGTGVGLASGSGDADTVPLVRVPPQYPIRASERGIEGYVDIRFTISPAGTVKDAVVIRAKPKGVFNRSALKAIKKWKYKPKVENGVPVERPGIEVRLSFDLDDT
jgi:protein TonB